MIRLFDEFINEAKKSTVHKAAKKGSFPAVVVVVQNGKVIHQEPVSTPEVAPAVFNTMQKEYPKATLHLEDNTGQRLFTEGVNTKPLKEYYKENPIHENVINNPKDSNFDGSDPKTIEVYNQGVGGVRTLQGHRDQIVNILEEMLKNAKMAKKNHKLAHFTIGKILNMADPQSAGGVLLHYLKNHQSAVEELESMRKRGGSGKGKTVPKGLI